MPFWIARPGRSLVVLEGIGLGLPLGFGLAFATRSGPLADMLFWLVAFLGPVSVALWALGTRGTVAALAEPSPVRNAAPWVLFALMGLGVLELKHPALELAAGSASLLAGVWSLEIARRSTRWIGGQIRIRDGVQLITPNATYLLDAAPAGACDGDWLTLPTVEMHTMQGGPFRSGRAAGWAPDVWPIRRSALTRGLVWRGVALSAWGLWLVGQLAIG